MALGGQENQEENDGFWLSFKTGSGENMKASSFSIYKMNSYWRSLLHCRKHDFEKFDPGGTHYLNICCCCCFVQLLSCVWLFATSWTAAHLASLSFTISQILLIFMFIELVMPANHLILCCFFLLLSSIFPSIRDFSRWSVSNKLMEAMDVSTICLLLPLSARDWLVHVTDPGSGM